MKFEVTALHGHVRTYDDVDDIIVDPHLGTLALYEEDGTLIVIYAPKEWRYLKKVYE